MQISKEVCGFTGGEADTLRKAIGKKKLDVMEKMSVKFIDGAVENGVPREVIERFWKHLLGFADYCFNKSHSACYGLIAYWTAYLKAHYPSAFMAAVMTSDQDDTDRLAIEISECKHMGIPVLSPDVNQSFAEFAVVPGTYEIRFGMNAVKNVGTGAVEEIIRAREEGGEFTSIEDFAKRVNTRIVNRKNWESLIRAGAFDRYGHRSDMLFNLDTILAFASKLQKDAASGQVSLFGDALGASIAPALQLGPAPSHNSDREMLQWERELLGLYISSHPLDAFAAFLREQAMPLDGLKSDMDGCQATVGGIVTDARQISTKNGDKMAFVKIENKDDEIEIIVFPKVYEVVKEALEQDKVIVAKGKINAKDRNGNITDDLKILAESVEEITDETLEAYRPTNTNMGVPDPNAKVRGRKRSALASRALIPGQKSVLSNHMVKNKQKQTPEPSMPVEARSQHIAAAPAPKASVPTLYIHVRNPDDHQALLKLKESLNEYPGSHQTVLVLGADQSKSAIKLPFTVEPHAKLLDYIGSLFGKECVVVK